MNWNKLKEKEQLNQLIDQSKETPQLIFKHSTRCAISSMALSRLERSWSEQEMTGLQANFLDLISHRDISNAIAEQFQVLHQSPQVLIIKEGKCIYEASHNGIDYQEIKSNLSELSKQG